MTGAGIRMMMVMMGSAIGDPAVTVVLEDSEAILQDLEVPSHRIVPATTRHTHHTTVAPATTPITVRAIMEATMDTVTMDTVIMATVTMDMATTTTTTMDIIIVRITTIMAPIMNALLVAAVIMPKPNKKYFLEE
ncbi:unnamed protein product [Caenorhabditis nigoni]